MMCELHLNKAIRIKQHGFNSRISWKTHFPPLYLGWVYNGLDLRVVREATLLTTILNFRSSYSLALGGDV